MRHFAFGRNNGLRVSEQALGTGMFGTRWGVGAGLGESRAMLDMFADAGGTFLDTAESYQVGESEEILGELLAGRRDRFTVATKCTLGVGGDADVLRTGNGRGAIVRAVEGSLRRLATDRIDLLWLHYPDGVTPLEEVVRALDDLVRLGKILYAGLSNFPAWQTARAATLAEVRGLAPIVAVQVQYSLVERSADREILPMTEALGLGAALFSPLGGGLLTGKYRTGGEGRVTTIPGLVHTEDGARKTAVVDEVLSLAAGLGVTPGQVAMAWLRERSAASTTSRVVVTGPRTAAQLREYLGSLEVRLDADAVARLDEVSGIEAGQPYEIVRARAAHVVGGPDVDFRRPVVPVA
ncbi:aldo/keto reductase [Streptomyces sp. NPDC026672]|uniref:aldo/keto reductase n=1 Tax=unclassified Streptomyces TaxID=2593676 RepID=UPI0033C81B6A